MKIGDKFILNIDYDTYHDANQFNDEDDNLTEKEYKNLFGKLVEVTDMGVTLTRDESWCQLSAVNSDWFLYIPESYCNYTAIVDENEINRINTIEKAINEKLSVEEIKLEDNKERRKKLLADRRDAFYEQALLHAIVGAGNACLGKPRDEHYGIMDTFIDEASGIALYNYDKYYDI